MEFYSFETDGTSSNEALNHIGEKKIVLAWLYS